MPREWSTNGWRKESSGGLPGIGPFTLTRLYEVISAANINRQGDSRSEVTFDRREGEGSMGRGLVRVRIGRVMGGDEEQWREIKINQSALAF